MPWKDWSVMIRWNQQPHRPPGWGRDGRAKNLQEMGFWIEPYRSIRTTGCHDLRYEARHEGEQNEVSSDTFPNAGKFDGLFSSRPRPLLPRRQTVNLHELRQDLRRNSQYSIVYKCWKVWIEPVVIYMHALL